MGINNTFWDLDIRTLTDAGVKLPDEYHEVKRRMSLASFDGPKPFQDRLISTVTNPTPDTTDADIAELRALAQAEASNGSEIAELVNRAGYEKLRSIYASVADEVWARLAAEFNTLAVQFSDAMAKVDPSLPIEAVFSKPKNIQEAWANGNSLARELDTLVPVLHTAAKRAGYAGDLSTDVLRFVVDHEGFYGEDVVPLGFDWIALVKLGVRIQAVTNLEDAKPWAMPQPEPEAKAKVFVSSYDRELLNGDWEHLGTDE